MKDLLAAFYVMMALIVLIVAMLGCAPEMTPAERDATEVKALSLPLTTGYDLRRVIDKEAGVVCYVHFKGGVSCLPLSETKLEE